MPAQDDGLVTFRDAEIIYRNFEGRGSTYNKEGDRNFCVVLGDDQAEALEADGWNIKFKKPREDDEDDTGFKYIQIALRFDIRPPLITLITNGGNTRTTVNEDTASVLDFADIAKIDLVFRPYDYDFAGNQGRKAYLKTAYITINEDELQREYAMAGD